MARQEGQGEQEDQGLGARLPSTGVKKTKKTKRINASVPVVTELTIMTLAVLEMVRPVEGSGKSAGGVVSLQNGRGGVEGGQLLIWPPSSTGAASWKAAKAANVLVTIMTDMTLVTPCRGKGGGPGAGT